MPLYEYKCVKCGNRFEKIEPVTASEVKKCPECGGRAERQLAAPAIQFKGSGWYVTDYAGKGTSSTTKEGSGDGAGAKTSEKTEKTGESKSGESKSSSDKASAKKKK
ncbi:MAG TPA: FmdB family zinc ribbon protein [Candidatus Acidoferrales bacterium]|nr:FmdB family zinc ribbon protein [Candidatus Acidoferrales bacterium]